MGTKEVKYEYTMITNKQQFIHFLKQNNVYEQFTYNFKNKKYLKMSFIQYLNCTEKYNFFYNAFPWHITKMGTQKWSELSFKWIEELQIPQQFIQFLQDNNIYVQYITLLIKKNEKYPRFKTTCSIKDVVNYCHPENYINICITSINDIQEKIKWGHFDEQWKSLIKRKYTTNITI